MDDTVLFPTRDDEIRGLLQRSPVIAVVGMSTDPHKPSHTVPRVLIDHGFHVIPVHPSAESILGRPAVRSLADIEEPVDLVNVFRPSRELAEVARQAAAIGAPAMWVQLDLRSTEARRIAEEAGMVYVEDRCLGVEVRRLGIQLAA